MLLSDIQSLDVINVKNGNKIGKIKDFDLDVSNGNVLSITVMTTTKIRSFFSGETLIEIPWQKIVKLGNDFIIIDYDEIS